MSRPDGPRGRNLDSCSRNNTSLLEPNRCSLSRVLSNLIYTAADGSYALQAQVLLHSLALTQTETTELRIFGNDWEAGERQRLERLGTEKVSARIIEVNDDQFAEIQLANGFPLATAYNILAPKYFIEDSGLALYLDADMVVTEDLSDLFAGQLTNCFAAVVDAHVAVVGAPSMWRPWREEGIDPLTPYLNTGTLLIDLDRWRDSKITENTLEYLAKYRLPCVDQDALNLATRGNFDRLAPKYNMMPYHLMTMFRNADLVEDPTALSQAVKNPAIIHYHRSFFGKPWTFGASHPGTRLWRSLADEVNPKWRRKIDFFNLARGRGARMTGMMKTDPGMRIFERNEIPLR